MNVNEKNLEKNETAGQEAAERKDRKAYAVSIGWGSAYALLGYCIGNTALPFGATPFGIALLCAVDRRAIYTFAGLCVAAVFGNSPLLTVGTYTAILLIRLLTRFLLDVPWSASEAEAMGEKTIGQIWHLMFGEQIGLRMATAALAAFGVGLCRLIRDGFLYYDLYGAMLMTIAAPVAVLLFTGVWSGAERGSGRHVSGVLSLAFVWTLAVKDFRLYGISLGVLGVMLLSLYMTRKRSLISGMLAGTICGLALSIPLAPAFAFGALAAGLLFPISPFFASVSAFSVSLAWGVYVNGIGVLNGFLPSLLAACFLFPVLDKLFFGEKKNGETEEREKTESPTDVEPILCRPLPALERDGLLLAEQRRKIRALSESLSSLSVVFRTMSERMQTPTETDLRQICDNAFDSSCVSCPERGNCWGERYRETSAEVGGLCAALHKNGRVERCDAVPSLLVRCGRLPDILEEINHNTARHRKELLEGDKTEIFAVDYEALAELLGGADVTAGEEAEVLTARLGEALTALNAGLTGVCVLGAKRKRVMVSGSDKVALVSSEAKIRSVIEAISGFPVGEGLPCEDGAVLCFTEKEKLTVSFAKRRLCAEGETDYCGDSVGTFCDPEGAFYGLISDGMGAGREAAMTSDVSSVFLQKLLGAGNSCDTALRMLNAFLRNRGGGSVHECSATVDLMALDLLSRRACFYKSGAAPTYVFRGGGLFKLRSHTVPVGILREPDLGRTELEVSAGDLIVMVSDGVTQGREECPWLFDLLRGRGAEASPEQLADQILRYAKDNGSADDLSVLVVRLDGQT